MSSRDMLCKMDDLGRLTIPAPIRRMLDWQPKDHFWVGVENKKVVMEKYVDTSNAEKVDDVLGICKKCKAISDDEQKTLIDILSKII